LEEYEDLINLILSTFNEGSAPNYDPNFSMAYGYVAAAIHSIKNVDEVEKEVEKIKSKASKFSTGLRAAVDAMFLIMYDGHIEEMPLLMEDEDLKPIVMWRLNLGR
jgi:hypothetical protein